MNVKAMTHMLFVSVELKEVLLCSRLVGDSRLEEVNTI